MGEYTKLAGRQPLMTVDEEINCGRAVQAMAHLLEKDPSTFNKEERKLYRRGIRARDRFVEGNMRMVMSVARRSVNIVDFLTYEDLCQEGAIGLQRAAEKFDPARGYKFSTYSYWWIRQAIGRAIHMTERTIRMPINVMESLNKLKKFKESQEKIGHYPSAAECMEHIGMGQEQFYSALLTFQGTASTDMPVMGDSDKMLMDAIVDPTSETVLEVVQNQEARRNLRDALDKLPERQKNMLIQYYGFDGHPSMTLSAMGKRQKVSREAIRQRLNKATLALKRAYNLKYGSPHY
ncbi:MAG: sigma-70 family RNA polymerase sigma factor [Synechococcus sp.]